MKKKLLTLAMVALTTVALGSCGVNNSNEESSNIEPSIGSSTITPSSVESSDVYIPSSMESSQSMASSQAQFSSSNIPSSTQAIESSIIAQSSVAMSSTIASSTAQSSAMASSQAQASSAAQSSAMASSQAQASSIAQSSAVQSSAAQSSSSSSSSNFEIQELVAYTEGAYITWNGTDLTSNYEVYYSNGGNYIKIDNELIRKNNNTFRADILGLKAGNYTLKVKKLSTNAEITSSQITVGKDDRSGYAHFNNTTGIGAYNTDGTLKSNAIVVYVNDNNKNTVKATVNGEERTGLVNIIKAAKNANEALDVRIIGEIQTQQWNSKTHGSGNTSTRQSNLDATFSSVNWDETTANELLNPDTAASSNYKKISEPDIIKYGINSMSDDIAKGITHLDGLTNNVLLSIKNGEYDSYYNELDVRNGNNITIEGVGTDAKIFQWGFCFNQCNSIEVKNIEFSDYTEDAIGIQGSNNDITLYSDYWIHNCTFNSGKNNWDVSYENDKKEGDGSTDFKSAHDLTISYCRYNGTHKTALIGSGDTSFQYNVTFHHNYYNTCGSRLPFTRNTNFHIYNCYYYNSTGTNMQIYTNAYALIEGCYFENTNKTFTTSNNGVIKLYNNTISGGSSTAATSTIVYVDNRTTKVTNSCKADNEHDFSTFDTDSSLFYYNTNNNISDVELMLKSTDVKSYIPAVAGSGLLKTIDFTKNYVENNTPVEDPADDSVVATYSESLSAPTGSGLFYTVLDNQSPAVPVAEGSLTTSTIVKENNGTIYVTDTNASATTVGYYMLEDSKRYTSGTHTYSFTIKLGAVGSKWQFIRLLDSNGNEYLNIGTATDKAMYYILNGGDSVKISDTTFAASTSYNISIIIDYDNNIATLSIGTNQVQISSFDINTISGIKFFTATKATDRSLEISDISIN